METRDRIPTITSFLMLGLALVFDVLQLIFDLTVFLAFFASVIALIGWGTLWFWFKLRGVTFSDNANRMAVAVLSPVLEFVPFLNMLPGLTLGTFITIASVRAADRERNNRAKEQLKAQEKATREAQNVENKNAAAYYNREAANENTPPQEKLVA